MGAGHHHVVAGAAYAAPTTHTEEAVVDDAVFNPPITGPLPPKPIDLDGAERAVRDLLVALGQSGKDEVMRNTPRRRMIRGPLVGVVGKGRNAERRNLDAAFLVGRWIADAGAWCVTGGLGGTMSAAAEGAFKHGGDVLSLLPDLDGNHEGDVHPFATLTIHTGLHHATRNVVMGSSCDLVIAMPGSHGTVQECAVALDVGTEVLYLDGFRPPPLAGMRAVPSYAALRSELRQLVDSHTHRVPQLDPS